MKSLCQGQQEEGAGGGKIPGARTGWRDRNLGKTSGNGCYCQDGWGPVMCNHLLVLGPGAGFRQPWFI